MNDTDKCFGIGCPLRKECARFGGEKAGQYIVERYDGVRCANQVGIWPVKRVKS